MLSIARCYYAVCHYAVPQAIPEQPTVQHAEFGIMILSINIDCCCAEYCRMSLCGVPYGVPQTISEQSRVQHGTFIIMILSINIDCGYADYRRMLLCSVSLCCAPSNSRTAHSTAGRVRHNDTQH
jgi:hypothetical protein